MAKIAIFNDDSQFVDLMSMLLSDAGHETITNVHEDGALDLVTRDRPDLVLLDITLDNGESGFKVLTMLRLTAETRDIPVVICTPRSPQEVEPLLARAGVARVSIVYKPFDLERLIAAVDIGLRSGLDGE